MGTLEGWDGVPENNCWNDQCVIYGRLSPLIIFYSLPGIGKNQTRYWNHHHADIVIWSWRFGAPGVMMIPSMRKMFKKYANLFDYLNLRPGKKTGNLLLWGKNNKLRRYHQQHWEKVNQNKAVWNSFSFRFSKGVNFCMQPYRRKNKSTFFNQDPWLFGSLEQCQNLALSPEPPEPLGNLPATRPRAAPEP